MRRFHWTRRAKVVTGISSLLVVVAAVLLVFSFTGVPMGGGLLGTASVDRGRDGIGPYFNLQSGLGGMQTGSITLKNNTKNKITLKSYRHYITDNNELWGWDYLNPGEQKKYDFYRGIWHLYYFNGEPTIVDCKTSGGGGIEGGLRMGPNSEGTTPVLGSDAHGNYIVVQGPALRTGVIGLFNDSDETITLRSFYQDSVEWSGPGVWKQWGEDTLAPHQGKRFDFTRDVWHVYYSGLLPVVDHYVTTGGGAGEGGLKMGPNGGR